ncbi:11627_t:CDS:2, partial [Paraglomus brasilianum]
MSDSQNTSQNTSQNIVISHIATSHIATSQDTLETDTNEETVKLKKYRKYWWKTGKYHQKANWEEASLPYELAIDVSWEEYVEKTDKYNIHGWWEWENGVVRVIELSSLFHESGVDAVVRQIHRATENVMRTNYDIIGLGTASHVGSPKKHASFRPVAKPRVNRGGSDGKNQPWPNLIVEFAYAETEAHIKDKLEKYWLMNDRAHDAIVIKIEPITSVTTPPTTPMYMIAWHYCINNVTAIGVLNPTMYEFGSVDCQGNPINPQLGQNVINIRLECLYHGVPNVVIPSLPLPNHIPIDLFDV